jgi:hypothetical protein
MISVEEMARVVGETWKSLSPAEKQPYETVAQAEMAAFLQNKRAFEVLHRQYSALHYAAQEAGAHPCWPPYLFPTGPNNASCMALER